MAKRISEEQKSEIVNGFFEGKSINTLSEKYKCTKLTITRNLKKSLGEKKYKEILNKNNSSIDILKKETSSEYENNEQFNIKNKLENGERVLRNQLEKEQFDPPNPFIEITPLVHDFDSEPQKDISSVPLSKIKFPDIVYLIVKKEIELETKQLKDYPEWEFLPFEDLNRKNIEIYFDAKTAKKKCNKDQKVIKVPNTDVLRIVSPILISRGISRIVTNEILISL